MTIAVQIRWIRRGKSENFKREGESFKRGDKSFTKPKPIMIDGQGEWEAGEIEKQDKGLHDSRRKRWRKERRGDGRSWDSSGKREQERETDVTNPVEWIRIPYAGASLICKKKS